MKTLVVFLTLAVSAFAQPPDAELRKLVQDYADAYARHDASALAGLYAEDALLLPPARPMLKGRPSIAEFWKKYMGGKLELTPVLVRGKGNVGYVVGKFALGNGGPTGKFTVNATRKNGKWEIESDMWNNDAD